LARLLVPKVILQQANNGDNEDRQIELGGLQKPRRVSENSLGVKVELDQGKPADHEHQEIQQLFKEKHFEKRGGKERGDID